MQHRTGDIFTKQFQFMTAGKTQAVLTGVNFGEHHPNNKTNSQVKVI